MNIERFKPTFFSQNTKIIAFIFRSEPVSSVFNDLQGTPKNSLAVNRNSRSSAIRHSTGQCTGDTMQLSVDIYTAKFNKFHEKRSKGLLWFIQSQLRHNNLHNAEDIASQIWLEAWQLLQDGTLQWLSVKWLRTRAGQRIIDHQRKQRTVQLDLDVHDAKYSMTNEVNMDYQTMLMQLDEQEATASRLYFQEGLTITAIATEMSVSLSKAFRLLHSGTDKMRVMFGVQVAV
jgi:RNA polymerase sigma factor (sigma-70 family)